MSEKCYVLFHRCDNDENTDKKIGIFTSVEIANQERIKRVKAPGFIEYPNGFRIDVYQIDQEGCIETIFL